jgi:hypothetical protein
LNERLRRVGVRTGGEEKSLIFPRDRAECTPFAVVNNEHRRGFQPRSEHGVSPMRTVRCRSEAEHGMSAVIVRDCVSRSVE